MTVSLLMCLTFVVSCAGGSGSTTATGSSTATSGLDIPLTPIGDGAPTSLAAMRGTPTVVNIWATWCVPCRTEMPAFEQVHQRYGDRVRIIGVTDPDDRANIDEMVAQTGVTYPLYVAAEGSVQSRLEVTGLPATFFLDADGNVVERHQGALTADALSATIERRYGIT